MSASSDDLVRTALRFGVVGVLTAILHYGLLVVVVSFLQWESTVASSVGFVVAVSFNYFMHYGWTFASGPDQVPAPHGRTLFRYLVMIACGFVINGSLMYLCVHALGWHYLLAQAIALVVVVLWNFSLANLWVFKS